MQTSVKIKLKLIFSLRPGLGWEKLMLTNYKVILKDNTSCTELLIIMYANLRHQIKYRNELQ